MRAPHRALRWGGILLVVAAVCDVSGAPADNIDSLIADRRAQWAEAQRIQDEYNRRPDKGTIDMTAIRAHFGDQVPSHLTISKSLAAFGLRRSVAEPLPRIREAVRRWLESQEEALGIDHTEMDEFVISRPLGTSEPTDGEAVTGEQVRIRIRRAWHGIPVAGGCGTITVMLDDSTGRAINVRNGWAPIPESMPHAPEIDSIAAFALAYSAAPAGLNRGIAHLKIEPLGGLSKAVADGIRMIWAVDLEDSRGQTEPYGVVLDAITGEVVSVKRNSTPDEAR